MLTFRLYKRARLQSIRLKKVRVHNLKGVDLELEPNELVVFTGVSGSGKSSLAFDTLYVEGQRRYVESLSTYARKLIGDLSKPDLDFADGITPTISIEQKSGSRNPRSTVGTITEIYDYLRVLYARVGIPHCPVSGEAVTPQSRERIIRMVQAMPEGTKLIILSPYADSKKGEFKEEFLELMRKGFTRVRVDGSMRTLDEPIELDRHLSHTIDLVIDRLQVTPQDHSRIAEAVTQALELGQGVMRVLQPDSNEETLYSMHAFSQASGLSYSSLEPHDFSFNSPQGMCPRCLGLGVVQEFDIEKVIDPDKSIAEDCCSVGSSYQTVRYGNIYDNLARLFDFDVHTPWKKLSPAAQKIFLYGTPKKWTKMHFVHPITGSQWMDHVQWRGVLYDAKTRFAEATSDLYRNKMLKLMKEQVCPECGGERLKPYPRATLLGGMRIGQLSEMTVSDLLQFFDRLKLSPQEKRIAEELLKEIRQRLQFLLNVGLNYISLNRMAPTLSGGEVQRVRLASQIGCGLVGITYILDEPSIGLHPRDNTKLIATLKMLRDIGNTVIVVEHDEETMLASNRIVEFGPGAGSKGGEILVNGSMQDLLKHPTSLTGAYLSGRLTIPIPKKRRKKTKAQIEIKGATHHNLKNVDFVLPLGLFACVTGVSGSGKSSLVTDILFPALSNELQRSELQVGAHSSVKGIKEIDKVIAIDQSPIGRNPRSTPATYIKLFDEIRDLFAGLPESKARGFQPGRFSFNVKEGSCPECHGMGMVKIDMDFLEEEWVECPVCLNQRFDAETLSVHFKGKNIHNVLEMDVEEALKFFDAIPSIRKKLEMLHQVGLDYMKLGQPSTTLSGGEAQRIKLAKELVRPSSGKTLYILDEPTTGLHFHDIKKLLEVLHSLVERGNSMVVIEHNMDLVKTADWIIDLGPEGGEGGGQIIGTGTPEDIAQMATPTGKALKDVLELSPKERLKSLKQKDTKTPPLTHITVEDAEQNNLKRISLEIPRGEITVCTGPSGSGKSSFAFDTVYAEGQRRYIESLSPYARQFVKQMPKPKVGLVEGLSPAVAIEQKTHAGNPRSTVGTLTEVYDYLRILYARLGIPHCPETGEVIRSISKEHVVERILELPEGTKVQILAPLQLKKQDRFEDVVIRLNRQGYVRIRLNGVDHDLDQPFEQFNYDRKRKNKIELIVDRVVIQPDLKLRLLEAVSNAASLANDQLIVLTPDQELYFNLAFTVESSGKSYAEITPQSFAFNKAEGMCPECMGLGFVYGANLQHQEVFNELSTVQILHLFIDFSGVDTLKKQLYKTLESLGIELHAPIHTLSNEAVKVLFDGEPEDHWNTTSQSLKIRWRGLNQTLALLSKAAESSIKEAIVPLLEEKVCFRCDGERLNPLARHVTIDDVSLGKFCKMPVDQALAFIEKIAVDPQMRHLKDVHDQIVSRLRFMQDVGIPYISLDRRAPSLSGGEMQRIRLARQLGSGLTGVLYVLDEPTIGLHPADNEKLNRTLHRLKDLGNTLLMVEHDPMTLKHADHLIDFGPASGTHGGHVTAQGTYAEILADPQSLTGAYLSGKRTLPETPIRKPDAEKQLIIQNAETHNLKKLNLEIPVGLFSCLTGVSGSGKSTLMHDVIAKAVAKGMHREDSIEIDGCTVSGISHFDRLITIDQNPIGTTSRSDVSTYAEVLGPLREFFASLPDAKMKGLQPRHFSYFHRSGMCTHCFGLGYKKVELHFLPSLRVECEECKGLRLNPVSLQVRFQGKNLGEILNLTVAEAKILFENQPRILRVLNTLSAVGLDYLRLGQEMASLSGGEAQRIKLSRELAKRSSGKTLYLLDEPTTGLHASDIALLLNVLQKLVTKGNTLIMIEHNLDMIRRADWIFDLGPTGGEAGGYLIAKGTPAQIQKSPKSLTGKYLKSN